MTLSEGIRQGTALSLARNVSKQVFESYGIVIVRTYDAARHHTTDRDIVTAHTRAHEEMNEAGVSITDGNTWRNVVKQRLAVCSSGDPSDKQVFGDLQNIHAVY